MSVREANADVSEDVGQDVAMLEGRNPALFNDLVEQASKGKRIEDQLDQILFVRLETRQQGNHRSNCGNDHCKPTADVVRVFVSLRLTNAPQQTHDCVKRHCCETYCDPEPQDFGLRVLVKLKKAAFDS